MKYFTNLSISLLFIFISLNLQAQDQAGIITYKGVVNEKFVDSFLTAYAKKKRPMAVRQRVVDAMRNARPEEFILNFKNNESYYYLKPVLEQEGYNMGSRASLVPYYTNTATDTIIKMSPSLGYIALSPIDWEITGKTKKIGDYTCLQAKTRLRLYSRQGHFYYKNVIAWFAPEIPLSFGPQNYSGLPGLILQIEDEQFTLTAIKINLNPTGEVKIKRLEKNDKVITQQESYNRIAELEEDRKISQGR